MNRLRKAFNFLVIFVLGLNLSIASIPRCAALISLWNAEEPSVMCHGMAQIPEDRSEATLDDGQFCECSLLSCTLFPLPIFEPESFIRFIPQTERVLVFHHRDRSSEFIIEIEPPYPRV